jgi:microcystin-dependent protein
MYSQDIIFSNNPKATLQGSISPTDTTAVLAVTEGAFPVLGANQGFTITFKDSATSLINEIVLVTGFNNATNTITSMLRGQENTTPRAWNSGDLANNLITAGYLNGLLQEQGALNGFLPVSGGTMTGEINYAQPITLASASTVLIGAAQSNNIVITGTTTITGFDSITAGATRNVTFTGALTLTHSTNLILPSNAQNITTAAGDSAVFQSLGSGNWKCLVYTRLNGIALVSSVDTGTVQMWAGSAIKAGFLLCDGQAVSRNTYAALFAEIGTTWGAGNGSTTFNLPNFADRMPIGAGLIAALGGTGGSKDAVVVSHTHTATVTDSGHFHAANSGSPGIGAGAGSINSVQQNTGSENTSTETTGISVTNSATGVSGTDANLPPYSGINFIIKT